MKTFNIANKISIYKFNNIHKKHENIICFISLKLGCKIMSISNLKNQSLVHLCYSYIRLFKFIFKIKGFGFKWKLLLTGKRFKPIILKLGLTHRMLLLLTKDTKIKVRKKNLLVKHRNIISISSLKILFYFYLNFLYYKKGIHLKGIIFKQKISKRKSKF